MPFNKKTETESELPILYLLENYLNLNVIEHTGWNDRMGTE